MDWVTVLIGLLMWLALSTIVALLSGMVIRKAGSGGAAIPCRGHERDEHPAADAVTRVHSREHVVVRPSHR
jgi:hypothetical protein